MGRRRRATSARPSIGTLCLPFTTPTSLATSQPPPQQEDFDGAAGQDEDHFGPRTQPTPTTQEDFDGAGGPQGQGHLGATFEWDTRAAAWRVLRMADGVDCWAVGNAKKQDMYSMVDGPLGRGLLRTPRRRGRASARFKIQELYACAVGRGLLCATASRRRQGGIKHSKA